MSRMIQAGARPITALTHLFELQRDWARTETYDTTINIATRFGGGGFGIGVQYAKAMFANQKS